MRELTVKSHDGLELFCYVWEDVENPKGILQITHGMAEHAKRYERFAKFMNQNGYVVFANDTRAHGKTAKTLDRVGKVVNGDLFDETTKDQIFLTKYIENNFKGLPIFLMGHSYGSFITQNYIQNCSIPKAVILMGSANQKNILTFFGSIIANMTAFFKGNDAKANLIAAMSFGAYQKKVKNGVWITSDKVEAGKYMDDEYCGAIFSAGFYKYFFKNLKKLYTKKGLAKIPTSYPLFIVSGNDDPVGGYGKLTEKLYNTYKNAGKTNVALKLYKDMRHEILNEVGYMEVYEDILNFIENNNK